MADVFTIDDLNALAALTAADEFPVWDSEESGEPTKKITAQNMTTSVKALGSLVNTSEMNNALAGKQNTLTFDTTPTTGSTNPVTSGGVADAIQQSTADVIRTGDVVNNLTNNDPNPVSSGAVYDAVLTYKGGIANISLNTVLLPGFYQARNNLTDSPVSDPWGMLLVLAPKGNTALASTIQILVSQSGTIYSRRADKDW